MENNNETKCEEKDLAQKYSYFQIPGDYMTEKNSEPDNSVTVADDILQTSAAKSEKFEEQLDSLNRKYLILLGVISLAGIIVIAVIANAVYELKRNEEFKQSLQTKQLEIFTAEVINQFNITKPSDKEKKEVIELKELVVDVEKSGFSSKRLSGLKALIDLLNTIVIEERMDTASTEVKSIYEDFSGDDFIISRAKVLDSLIVISQDRNKTISERKNALVEVIRLDYSNAGAFNALGILLSNESRDKLLDEKDFYAAKILMKQAAVNFDIAASLNPSSIGTYKCMNNKIWGNMVLFRGFMVRDSPRSKYITTLMQELNHSDEKDFFETSRATLQLYEQSTDFPPAPETMAQLYFLEAEYMRKTNPNSNDNELKARDLEYKGALKFNEAIYKGLYKKVKSREAAIEQFDKDFLHEYIIIKRPDLADSIRNTIRNTFAN